MKVSLIVADGVHKGKIIPVNVREFKIGRDPDCQLRPASPAISKQHCALIIRDGKVFFRDFGSTNGSFVNHEQAAGEQEVKAGDHLKAGPLEFTLQVEGASVPALKAVPAPVAAVAAVATQSAEDAADAEMHAMMMLSDGDDHPSTTSMTGTNESSVPDGTTIMEIPAIGGQAKPDDKKNPRAFNANTSDAAKAILSKYLRRPRT
jgi:pSer/pThr/pTyr-binding forkhead associated (FHA) protein